MVAVQREIEDEQVNGLLVGVADVEICRTADGRRCRLGEGGFGVVYKALMNGVDEVAMKLVKVSAPLFFCTCVCYVCMFFCTHGRAVCSLESYDSLGGTCGGGPSSTIDVEQTGRASDGLQLTRLLIRNQRRSSLISQHLPSQAHWPCPLPALVSPAHRPRLSALLISRAHQPCSPGSTHTRRLRHSCSHAPPHARPLRRRSAPQRRTWSSS